MTRANHALRRARQVSAAIYSIDRLEPRLLLAINNTWVGPVDGNWDVGANWSRGSVPAANDRVFIGIPEPASVLCNTGASRNISELFVFDSNLSISSGTLAVASVGVITGGTFNLSDGAVTNNGSLTISDTVMNWSGGMLAGAGTIQIANTTGSEVNITDDVVLNTTLENRGEIDWSTGTIELTLAGSVVNFGIFQAADKDSIVGSGDVHIEGGTVANNLFIRDGATLVWTDGEMLAGGMTRIDQSASLNISGTAEKQLSRTLQNFGAALWFGGDITTAGTGVFNNMAGASLTVAAPSSDPLTIGAAFNNSGNVVVTSGEFQIAGGGTSTGDFLISGPGARLHFDVVNYSTTSTCAILGIGDGAALEFSGSSHVIGGLIDVPVLTTSANMTFNAKVNIASAGTFDADVTFNGELTRAPSATLTVRPHALDPTEPHVLRTKINNLPPNININVNDNAVVVDYTGGRSPTLNDIQNLINAGRNSDTGFFSTEARNQFEVTRVLAAIEASDYLLAGHATFVGQAVDATTVLVRYTWYGDTDLNGVVNFDDYVRTDSGYNNGKTGWFNGDFDTDGEVDFDDYALLDKGFNQQGPPSVFFTNDQKFGTGALPHTSESADLNGDGLKDLIAANQDADSISIFRNTTPVNPTKPSFASAQTLPAGALQVSVAPVDVNNDGKIDLVVANAGELVTNEVSELLVYVNTTPTNATTFSFEPPISLETGLNARTRFVIAGNFNDDSKPDLITANFRENDISVFRNTSSSGIVSFTKQPDLPNPTGRIEDPVTLSSGDYNSDTRLDFVVANQVDGSVTVFLNTTPAGGQEATFSAAKFMASDPFDPFSTPRFVSSADFNGDQKLDLVVANHGPGGFSNRITVLFNDGAGSFLTRQGFNLGSTVLGPIGLDVGDVNGDGRIDVAVSNFISSNVSILLNTASTANSVTFGLRTNLQVGSNPIFVNLDDLNGDNKLDLAVANYYGNSLSVLLNRRP